MITFPKRFLNIFKHTSSDGLRPALNCVKLDSDGKGHFTMLATDGHILTQLQYDSSQKDTEPINGMIPHELFQQAQSIYKNWE